MAADLVAARRSPTTAPAAALALGAHIWWRGRLDWVQAETEMRTFTEARTPETPDALWLCDHPPIYTLGVAGRAEHVLDAAGIAVLRSTRGGQVTYHGPGQVMAYPLVDLRRLGVHVKEYVYRIEQAVLQTLQDFGITGHRVPGAPGIYVRLADPAGHAALQLPLNPADPWRGLGKVAALGLKVTRHCAYHGVALNVAMDLSPFERIHACGHPGLQTVDLSRIGVNVSWDAAADRLARHLSNFLSP